MKLRVYRGDEVTSYYDVFEIERGPGMTVLEALFLIQAEQDDSLVFRYSCRGAVCGSCAMLINKVPRLACRSQLSRLLEGEEEMGLNPYPALEVNIPWDPGEEVLVEPLPHLPLIKDLVVDQKRFFDHYRAVHPRFEPAGDAPERERRMDREDVAELEKYTNCILCTACFGACPVNGEDPEYLGPAALAKLYRFAIDPREGREDPRLMLANIESGWWACKFHANCKRVCPKKVPPNVAIAKARLRLQKSGKAPSR